MLPAEPQTQTTIWSTQIVSHHPTYKVFLQKHRRKQKVKRQRDCQKKSFSSTTIHSTPFTSSKNSPAPFLPNGPQGSQYNVQGEIHCYA